MTIAARECNDYADVRANLARNNIMESLEDLGADTLHEAGDPIDPRTEREGQPNCRPIVDWRFTFGTSYRSRAVRGPSGALSIVTDPDGGNVPVTKATVPARDFDGHPVSGGVNRSALWSPRTCAPAGEHSASHEPTTATTPTFMRIRSRLSWSWPEVPRISLVGRGG